MNNKWIQRFLKLAQEISTWSKDPSTQIGAVIVNDDRQVLSVGYNGFPRNMKDDADTYLNREEKYERIVHAEMNAIYNATHNGVSLKDSILFVHGLPVCSNCAIGVIQVGIKEVYMRPINTTDLWRESFQKTSKFFEESKVKYKIL